MLDDLLKPENYLPEMKGIAGVLQGRNMREGYQRAWGLAHGDLAFQIGADPDFYECVAPVRGRCITDENRLKNLFLLFKFFLPRLRDRGHIIEFGCYRGGAAIFMAQLAARFLPGVHVFALDTFGGMPETTDLDAHHQGDFIEANLADAEAARDALGIDNLTFVKGLFQETAQSVLRDARTISLAHIDCDIHSGVVYSYDAVRPYMVPGGYVVFDDATQASCQGATAAVEEYVIQR